MEQTKQFTNYQLAIKRLLLLNRYYKITKFYSFLGQTALKGGITVLVFVLILLGIDWLIIDIRALLSTLIENTGSKVVFSLFLLSESTLGIILPEALIAWAAKSNMPWLLLAALSTTSYIGGIIAYFIGNRLHMVPSLRNYLENKAEKHIRNLKRWGGLFIILGAISPIPHSLVSMASGLIRYKFSHYLIWALFRYVRFIFYAVIIFQIY